VLAHSITLVRFSALRGFVYRDAHTRITLLQPLPATDTRHVLRARYSHTYTAHGFVQFLTPTVYGILPYRTAYARQPAGICLTPHMRIPRLFAYSYFNLLHRTHGVNPTPHYHLPRRCGHYTAVVTTPSGWTERHTARYAHARMDAGRLYYPVPSSTYMVLLTVCGLPHSLRFYFSSPAPHSPPDTFHPRFTGLQVTFDFCLHGT